MCFPHLSVCLPPVSLIWYLECQLLGAGPIFLLCICPVPGTKGSCSVSRAPRCYSNTKPQRCYADDTNNTMNSLEKGNRKFLSGNSCVPGGDIMWGQLIPHLTTAFLHIPLKHLVRDGPRGCSGSCAPGYIQVGKADLRLIYKENPWYKSLLPRREV